MRTSSETPPSALDEAKIRACRAANTYVLPGIGSVLARRRVGYAQLALAAAGFGISNWWMIKTVTQFFSEGFIDLNDLRQLILPLFGINLFILAWIWAQFTNRALLKSLPPKPPKIS